MKLLFLFAQLACAQALYTCNVIPPVAKPADIEMISGSVRALLNATIVFNSELECRLAVRIRTLDTETTVFRVRITVLESSGETRTAISTVPRGAGLYATVVFWLGRDSRLMSLRIEEHKPAALFRNTLPERYR